MVSYANAEDAHAIVALARREHELSHWSHLPFDEAATNDLVLQFIRGHGKTLLYSGGGYLAGMVQPLGFARRLVALEFAWYAQDGSGMELLRRFEAWAKNMGASAVVAHNYMNDQRLGRVLVSRMGYSGIGQAMSKNLES